MEDFEQKYKALKAQWLTDAEIAKKLFTNTGTLDKWKRQYGIKWPNKCKKNPRDVTEAQFAKAAEIGLSRRRVLTRIRDDGWSTERAISEPLKKRRNRSH